MAIAFALSGEEDFQLSRDRGIEGALFRMPGTIGGIDSHALPKATWPAILDVVRSATSGLGGRQKSGGSATIDRVDPGFDDFPG
jgi:hypothetical protein